MAHKDLSDEWRLFIEVAGEAWARDVYTEGQSLALAREAWINAFDNAAEQLSAQSKEGKG